MFQNLKRLNLESYGLMKQWNRLYIECIVICRMTSIDEAKEILMNFQQNHYFINNKAISKCDLFHLFSESFVKNGMNMDIRKTVDGMLHILRFIVVICDPAISLTLNDACVQLIKVMPFYYSDV